MMMNGKWIGKWDPVQAKDDQGRFLRQTSSFRNWITPDGRPGPTGQGGYRAEAGRYHLYVGYICPWASRVLAVLRLKGLEQLITVSVVSPQITDQGWAFADFPGATDDPLFGAGHMHDLYSRADPTFTGRATVPLLWDRQTNSAVNNESADIIRMLNTAFSGFVDQGPDLYPADLADQIDALNAQVYDRYNNGVYKCGFASSQAAYSEALGQLFEQMDQLEAHLSDGRPFVFGDRMTETDIRIFVTSIRFDAAYHGLFKCNLKSLRDYPRLQAHMERVLNIGGIAETVHLDHIKGGYYALGDLNPGGLVPEGPQYITDIISAAKEARHVTRQTA